MAAHLGIASIAVLSMKPDKNLDYSITIRTPTGETLKFIGQTGCDHKVGPNGSGYRTMNRASTISHNAKDWMLLGIDCNYAIDNRHHNGYKLYQLTNEGVAFLYFAFDGSSTSIVDYSFESHFSVSINKTETEWPNYDRGPYFYRKIKLSNIPWHDKENMKNRVIYINETCGKENVEGNREKITKAKALKYNFFHSYNTGTLAPTVDLTGWVIHDAIDLKRPIVVSKKEYKPEAYIRKSGPPSGCIWLNYKGGRYLLSEYGGPSTLGGAFLYIPDEESIIQIKRASYYDVKTAMEDSLSWSNCDEIPVSLDVKNSDTLIDQINRKLVRYNGNNFECSKFQRVRWL